MFKDGMLESILQLLPNELILIRIHKIPYLNIFRDPIYPIINSFDTYERAPRGSKFEKILKIWKSLQI